MTLGDAVHLTSREKRLGDVHTERGVGRVDLSTTVRGEALKAPIRCPHAKVSVHRAGIIDCHSVSILLVFGAPVLRTGTG